MVPAIGRFTASVGSGGEGDELAMPKARPVSLHPLTFDEAIKAPILKPPKRTQKRCPSRRRQQSLGRKQASQ